MRSCVYLLSLVCLLGLGATAVQAAAPAMINYQGYLTDAVGMPLNETVEMEFNLSHEEIGGTPLWSESQSGIVVSEGIFNVILGSSVPLDLSFDVPYYLGIRINGEEMAPRKPLLNVPYALNAKPAAPAPGSYTPGLVSTSPYENCIQKEDGLACTNSTLLTVAVAKGTTIRLEGTIQPGADLPEAIAITLTRQGDTIECTLEKGADSSSFILSAAVPLFDGLSQGAPIDVKGQLLTDGLVALTVLSDMPSPLRQVMTEARGILEGVENRGPERRHIRLVAMVLNVENLPTNYLVTVSDCTRYDDLIPAQWITLDPGEEESVTFDLLYNSAGFTGKCDVRLWAPSGRLYDEIEPYFDVY